MVFVRDGDVEGLRVKREGEEYEAYLNRVASNPIALEVKLADLRDNLDGSRGAPANVKREAKYRMALAKLENDAKRVIPAYRPEPSPPLPS